MMEIYSRYKFIELQNLLKANTLPIFIDIISHPRFFCSIKPLSCAVMFRSVWNFYLHTISLQMSSKNATTCHMSSYSTP